MNPPVNTPASVPVARETYKDGVRRVLLVTLALNIAVVIGKLVAGLLAGSLSVISDALHSSVDSLNNIVGLVVIRYATAEPDEDHPYGHAKFETLAAFVIAGFLFVTCWQILLSAGSRLIGDTVTPPEITWLTLVVMILTIVVNVIVTTWEHREGKRLQSEFLIADAVHTRSDVLVSSAILTGLLLIRAGYNWLDPALALVVAGVIAWNGYKIFKATVPVLVDAAPIPTEEIVRVVSAVQGVHSVHDVRSRGSQNHIFIEMHLHVEPEIEPDPITTHDITEEVERVLASRFGQVIATIHVEPLAWHTSS
ncbi:MAG: cation diffusion facilitator family transporter [Blastocatellia bacterium]